MTVYRLQRGARVTYNGTVATVERRSIDPVGYWIRSERDPEYVFVVRDDEIALAVEEKGPLRIAGMGSLAATAATDLSLPEPTRLSERDHLVMSYRRRVAETVDRQLRDTSLGLTKRAATRAALATVAAPAGVAPMQLRTAAAHLRTWKAAGCRPLALAPRNGWKGNHKDRKPAFVRDAVEEAIDEKFRGWGSLPRVRQHAISIARRVWEKIYRKAAEVDGLTLPLDADGDIDWMELVSAPYVRARKNLRSARFRAEKAFGPEQARMAFDTALAGPLYGLEYNSDALGALRGDHGGLDGRIRDVDIKHLAEDISTVWALLPDPRRPDSTLAVPAYCKQMHYARGLSEYRHWVISEHAKETAKEGVITVHQLMEAKQRLALVAKDMLAQRVANGGAAKVDAVLKAHRTYLKQPTELPEDAPDARDPLALVDRESFGVTPARADRSRERGPEPATPAAAPAGGRPRRKLGRLDDV